MNKFDEIDATILTARIAHRENIKGMRVGDFVIFPDGHRERFSHDWDNRIQTTDGRFGSSFYLDRNGEADFSGGLNPGIDKSRIEETQETAEGDFWFFHHNHMRAHNGVDVTAPCRVFAIVRD